MKLPKVLEPLELSRREFAVLCVLFSALLVGIVVKYMLDNRLGSRGVELIQNDPKGLGFKLDINKAEWYELALLPHIGEKRAKAIVEYRERHGPFGQGAELLKVKGITKQVFEAIKDYIIVN